MYVRSLKIENLRCFERATMDLQFPGREQEAPPELPNVNLLLGNNGAGKTTVLKAIALGVLELSPLSSGFNPINLVRRKRDVRKAEVRVDQVFHPEDNAVAPDDLLGVTVTVTKVKDSEILGPLMRLNERDRVMTIDELFESPSPASLLVGYGSTRADASQFEPVMSQQKHRVLRYQRVAGLFEEFIRLIPLSSWLPRLQIVDASRVEEVAQLLNDLLPRESRFLGEVENGEYLFMHCGIPVPLSALSDGYRAYIGWVSDLLCNISLGAPKGSRLRDARGVVLVDEIDLHLHPEWQREVVPTVARALPNLQFVLTTHSPIVAGTLSAKNIFVLEMDGAGASTIRQLTEPIHGLNADQILVSSYFGLKTSRAQSAEDKLRQLSRRAMSGDSGAALEFLKKLTTGTETPPAKPKPSAASAARPRRKAR